jgi:hypothetical protein
LNFCAVMLARQVRIEEEESPLAAAERGEEE